MADSSSFRCILKTILQLIESISQSTQLASKLNCYSRKTGTIHSKNIAIKLISKRRPFRKQKEYLTSWTFYFLPSAQKSRYSLNALIGASSARIKKCPRSISGQDLTPLPWKRAVLHECRTRGSHFSSWLTGVAWLQPAKSSCCISVVRQLSFFFVPCRRSLAATCEVLESFHFLPGYLPSLRFESGSTGAQYVALHINLWWRKLKTFLFGSAKCFWPCVLRYGAEASKRYNTA